MANFIKDREQRGLSDNSESEKRKQTRFFANIIHEIKTPINNILLLSDLTLKTGLSKKQEKYIKNIHLSADFLSELINDILDISRIEAGKLFFESISFNIRRVIEEIADIFADLLFDKKIEIIIDISADVPEKIIGDPLRTRQVLINLFSNAVKYTEQGEICVSVKVKDKKKDFIILAFSVLDSGVGFDVETFGKDSKNMLFDYFSQANISDVRKRGGTGLGLAICKNIVELMDGEISIKSKKGVGSELNFTVKFIIDHNVKNTKYILPDLLKEKVVLIAGRNLSSNIAVKRMIESFGCRVKIVESGEAAIDIYKASLKKGALKIGFILIDVLLYSMDGLSTAIKIKKEPEGKLLPVIIFNSRRKRDVIKGEMYGITHFIDKPVKRFQLFETILNACGYEELNKKENISKKVLINNYSGIKVIVADDDSISRMAVVELLKELGVIVFCAVNGQEVLNYVKKESIDVVLMDIYMPVMDGIEVTEKIRGELCINNIYIFALTASSLRSEISRCLEAGMNGFMSKPVGQKDLFSMLDKFIDFKQKFKPEELKKEIETAFFNNLNKFHKLYQIDVKKGVERLGDNLELYVKLIGLFISDYSDAGKEIKKAIARKDTFFLKKYIHTLKGLSANFEAFNIRNLTEKCEMEFASGENLNLTELISDLEKCIEDTIVECNKIMDLYFLCKKI